MVWKQSSLQVLLAMVNVGWEWGYLRPLSWAQAAKREGGRGMSKPTGGTGLK